MRFALPTARAPEDIFEVEARFRRELLRRENAAVKDLLAAWKSAQKAIRARSAKVEQKIRQAQSLGLEISPAWLFQQERFRQLLDEIVEQTARFAPVAERRIAKLKTISVELGVAHAEAYGAAGVDAGWIRLPAEPLQALVGTLADGSPLSELLLGYGPDAAAAARHVMIADVAAGRHPSVIAKHLKKAAAIPMRNAVMMARTESLRAYRIAQVRNYQANSRVVQGMRVSSARDGRTCALCLAQDGAVLELGEDFFTHVMCRCALLPVTIRLAVDRGTGEQWLSHQGEDFQRRTLGPSRYELWKSGKISLQDLLDPVRDPKWGPTMRAKPLARIKDDLARRMA